MLGRDSSFKFVGSSDPALFLSDDGAELICKDPSTRLYSLTASLQFESSQSGSFQCDVIFDLGGLPYLIQTLRVEVADSKSLAALKELMSSRQPLDGHWDVSKFDIVYSRRKLSAGELPHNIPDPRALASDIDRLGIGGNLTELTQNTYRSLFCTLLFLEEMHCRDLLRSFSARDVPLVAEPDKRFTGVCKVTLTRPVPPRTAQRALIRPSDSERAYEVPVVAVHDDCVEVDVAANVKLAHVISNCEKVTVDFQLQPDSAHFSQLHRSICNLPETVLVAHLLAVESESGKSSSRGLPVDCSELNSRQRKAINLILSSSSHTVIVNGPSGTGKTRLLTEAIRLLTLTRKNLKVLVCTKSNHAADLYVESFHLFRQQERLKGRVMRICYPFRNVETLPLVVRLYCNYMKEKGRFVMPGLEEFYESADSLLVVTTLFVSSQLLDASLQSGFFTHIFIDEAAQATEPESVTPLALAGPKTVLVLAGDCCQVIVYTTCTRRSCVTHFACSY